AEGAGHLRFPEAGNRRGPVHRLRRSLGLGGRGRRLRRRGHGRREREAEDAGANSAARANLHHLPPTETLKLYLAENWIRKSSDVKPSRKFSRLPHWTSGPSMTFDVG